MDAADNPKVYRAVINSVFKLAYEKDESVTIERIIEELGVTTEGTVFGILSGVLEFQSVGNSIDEILCFGTKLH